MDVSIYVIECVIMCAVFGVFVFGMMLVNPVSFIGDYPPEIQAQYYSFQHKEAVKERMTFLTILRKSVAIIAFLFLFAWMAHIAGAETFVDGLLLVYGYMLVLAVFDTCFLDWVLFANIKRVRLRCPSDFGGSLFPFFLARLSERGADAAALPLFSRSNEPSSRACTDIWRLPRGSNTPVCLHIGVLDWSWLVLREQGVLPRQMVLSNPLIFYLVLKLLTLLMPDSAFRLAFTNGLMSESMVFWFGSILIWLRLHRKMK